VLRQGTAAVGIRLVWARTQDGRPATASLVDDGEPAALRLTVEHRADHVSTEAGAAFWVRIGTGLDAPQAFAAWRQQFEQAHPGTAEATDEGVRVDVPGEEGRLAIAAAAPYGEGGVRLLPEPARGALEIDGREIGRPLLEAVESPVHRHVRHGTIEPMDVPEQGGLTWEAEDGLVFHGMIVDEDSQTSAGRYVVRPDDRDIKGPGGSVTWPLRTAKAGRYYLWCRVLAPDEKHNSLFVSLISDAGKTGPRRPWHVQVKPQWNWQCVGLEKSKTPAPLELPAGIIHLQFTPRENGTKIDRLFLTADPQAKPE
jgi:hypothetical protein